LFILQFAKKFVLIPPRAGGFERRRRVQMFRDLVWLFSELLNIATSAFGMSPQPFVLIRHFRDK
jgi:hypothetical protein